MSKLEISDLQEQTELLIEVSDEVAEEIQGGGFFTDALNAVLDWIVEPNDGSAGGAFETTGRAVVATPAVATLALWSAVEQKIEGH